MDKPFEAPRGRLLPTLVIFFFVLGVLYTLYLIFDQMRLNGSIKSIQEQETDLQVKIDDLKSEQIEELYIAQQLKDKVEASSVTWSGVIRDLQDLTPVTVFLNSFTVTEDGGIQVSGLGDSFGSVADIITSLEKAANYGSVFVPSVTAGTTADGQAVVTFSLKAQYLPD